MTEDDLRLLLKKAKTENEFLSLINFMSNKLQVNADRYLD